MVRAAGSSGDPSQQGESAPAERTGRIEIGGGEGGIRTLGTGYPVRQISNLVPSTTRPPLRSQKLSIGGAFGRAVRPTVPSDFPRRKDGYRPCPAHGIATI